MKKLIMQTLADEIDNLIYFILALILVALAAWLKPTAEVMVMVSGLFGALLLKIKGSESAGKLAAGLKVIIKK